jgi:hypothetical protein
MKYTIKEFAQKIRDQYSGDYDDLSDQELINLWIKKYPGDEEKIYFEDLKEHSNKSSAKYTVNEFASEIRKLYPGEYDDLSDQELVQKWLQKYPNDADKVEIDHLTLTKKKQPPKKEEGNISPITKNRQPPKKVERSVPVSTKKKQIPKREEEHIPLTNKNQQHPQQVEKSIPVSTQKSQPIEENKKSSEVTEGSGCFKNFLKISILLIGILLIATNPSKTKFEKLLCEKENITADDIGLATFFLGDPSNYLQIDRKNYLFFSVYSFNVKGLQTKPTKYIGIFYHIIELE